MPPKKQEAVDALPDGPAEVELHHPDGSTTTVLKPSAEYTNLTGVYGWKEV